MKRHNTALFISLFLSGSALLGLGAYEKYGVLRPLGLDAGRDIAALPFQMLADDALIAQLEMAREELAAPDDPEDQDNLNQDDQPAPDGSSDPDDPILDPNGPGDPSDPNTPDDPSDPNDPGDSPAPDATGDPSNPSDPDNPTGNDQDADPTPGDNQTPGDSQTPGDTQSPGDSQTPGDTQNPGDSQTPGDNQTPDNTPTPTTPDAPNTPDTTPNNPDNHNQPDTTTNPSDTPTTPDTQTPPTETPTDPTPPDTPDTSSEDGTKPADVPSTTAPGEPVGDEWFDDVLFIGDSRTMGLRDYVRVGKADYFCYVGASVFNIYKKTASDVNFKDKGIDYVLGAKQYGKVFINLGYNECGYPMKSLMNQYTKFLNTVREAQPDAKIILQGIMTAGHKEADKYEYYQPSNIFAVNKRISELADGVTVFYIDFNEVVADDQGFLPSEYSGDGAHLYAKYYPMWMDWIRRAVAGI